MVRDDLQMRVQSRKSQVKLNAVWVQAMPTIIIVIIIIIIIFIITSGKTRQRRVCPSSRFYSERIFFELSPLLLISFGIYFARTFPGS